MVIKRPDRFPIPQNACPSWRMSTHRELLRNFKTTFNGIPILYLCIKVENFLFSFWIRGGEKSDKVVKKREQLRESYLQDSQSWVTIKSLFELLKNKASDVRIICQLKWKPKMLGLIKIRNRTVWMCQDWMVSREM